MCPALGNVMANGDDVAADGDQPALTSRTAGLSDHPQGTSWPATCSLFCVVAGTGTFLASNWRWFM
jgi:hypothetical protein